MRPLLAATQGNAALLVGLALAAGFAGIAALLSERTRGRYLPVICLIAAIGYYGAGATGFVLDIAIAYPAVHWLGAQRDAGMRWRAACLFMLVLGALFTAGRAAHASPFVVALDMWLVLRLVTLVWEVGSGAVNPPSPSQYVAWTCLPLTLAGPLLRYSEFVVHRDPRSSADAWVRCLATGLLKLVAGIGLSVADRAVTFALPDGHVAAAAQRALVTGPLGFYLTLAGYYQAMQALGARSGIPLPDSFNWPIGRQNIGDFWANWNMTATRVFRDYLFYNRWGRGTYNIFLNTLLLFTAMGLWHGANVYWVSFGVLHGLAFCGFLVWRRYRGVLEALPLRGTAGADIAARVLTYVTVCACWYLPTKIAARLGNL